MARKPKPSRYARTIRVEGEEVYTRFSKREYETRRDIFDSYSEYGSNLPPHLADYSYDEWTEWGTQGGRPRKWPNEKTRKKAERAKAKLAQGQPLTYPEKELLGLIKRRPGAYKSELGRPMTPAERKRTQRARMKGGKEAM